jgi:hypothetical protein
MEKKIASELKRGGYSFSSEALAFATHSNDRDKIYESLRRELGILYKPRYLRIYYRG